MSDTTTHVTLRRRPHGMASADDFEVVSVPMPTPGDGELLVRTRFLSLDPYMRGRMSDGPSYATPVAIGSPMVGAIVGDVIASRAPSVPVGTVVTTSGGWRSHVIVPASAVRIVDPAVAPISTALGVLGMPGQTAWYGLNRIGHPKAGETVVVAAATGAVGSVVGQLARLAGCHVVGIAGSDEKCAHAVHDLGFDVCLNHRAHDANSLRDALRQACPRGIDVYFESLQFD